MAGDVLAQLYVEITAKTDKLQSDLSNVKKDTDKLSDGFAGLKGAVGSLLPAVTVAAVVTGFTQMLKASMEYGDNMEEMSQRTGMGTDALQGLSYAAKVSGSSINEVEIGVKRMQVAITNASQGAASSVEAFNRLGISIYAIKNLSPENQFIMIANAISKISDPTIKAAAAVEIFGRSGTALLPMMNDMDALMAKARSLGIILSQEDIAAMAKANDAADTLGIAWQGLTNRISIGLLPALTEMINALSTLCGWLQTSNRLSDSLMANPGKYSFSNYDENGRYIGAGSSPTRYTSQGYINGDLPSYDIGGIVPGSGPQLAMVHGGETIIPAGSGGNTITVSQLVVREEADINRIARELYRLQVLRG